MRRAKQLEAGARASERADAAGQLIAENAAALNAAAAAASEEEDAASDSLAMLDLVTHPGGDVAVQEPAGCDDAESTAPQPAAAPPVDTPVAAPALKRSSTEDAALRETLSGLIKQQKQEALARMRAGDISAAKAALERARDLEEEFAQV